MISDRISRSSNRWKSHISRIISDVNDVITANEIHIEVGTFVKGNLLKNEPKNSNIPAHAWKLIKVVVEQ